MSGIDSRLADAVARAQEAYERAQNVGAFEDYPDDD
jgi:hypothetical protein